MKLEEVAKRFGGSKVMLKQLMLLITFTVFIVFAVVNLDACFKVLGQVLSILSPFLTGIVFAYILNIIVQLFENRVFARLNERNGKVWKKVRRGVCILIAFLIVFGIITLIMFLVIPELINSVGLLAKSLPAYFNHLVESVDSYLAENPSIQQYLDEINLDFSKIEWDKVFSSVSSFISGGGKTLVSMTMGFTTGVVNIILSLVFSVYLLAGKEKLITNLRRVIFAFLPRDAAKKVMQLGSLSNRIFTGYIAGQVTEALILGTLCFLGMSILRLPYSMLVSVIIAVTSLIPVFGAYIGGIIGGLIIFIVDPLACLWFAIYIVLLQNLEGNLIYPRVVGSSVGLPGIWVMASIFICGNLFGFVGMLIGVPVTSVIYTLFKEATAKRLQKKHITGAEIEQASKSEILADEVPLSTEKVNDSSELDRQPKQKN